MNQVDFGRLRQQLANQMSVGAQTRRTPAQAIGLGADILDEAFDIFDRQLGVDHQHQRWAAQQRNVGEIFQRVVHMVQRGRCNHMRANARNHQVVAIGCQLHHRL